MSNLTAAERNGELNTVAFSNKALDVRVLKSTSCFSVAAPIFTSLIMLMVCFLESCDFFFCA